jgi:GMP synthase-like glutamine amidotransferase
MSIQDPPYALPAPRHARSRLARTHDHSAGAGAIAVVRRESEASLGLLADVLETGRVAPRIIRVDRGQPLPAVQTISVAVSLGGLEPTADAQPIRATTEIDWLRRAHDAGVALLGIGSGAHAVAVALGGATEPARRRRHGWVQVASTEPGRIPAGPWFSWTDDAILLPPGAELLAHDDSGPQVFRVGRHVGIQFHPEVTPEIIGGFLRDRHRAGIDTQGVVEAGVREFTRTTANAYRLLSAVLDFVSLIPH